MEKVSYHGDECPKWGVGKWPDNPILEKPIILNIKQCYIESTKFWFTQIKEALMKLRVGKFYHQGVFKEIKTLSRLRSYCKALFQSHSQQEV